MENSSENWAGIKRFYLKCSTDHFGRTEKSVKKDLCERVVNQLIADNIATFEILGDAITITLPIFIDSIADHMRGIVREGLVGRLAEMEKADGKAV